MPRTLGLLAIFLSSSLALHAQTATEPARGPDAVTRSYTPGIDVLPYPNLPFSGIDTIVETRPVDGGGSIVNTLTSRIVRDGQGKIYRERHHFAPQGTDPQKTLYQFYILDPRHQHPNRLHHRNPSMRGPRIPPTALRPAHARRSIRSGKTDARAR